MNQKINNFPSFIVMKTAFSIISQPSIAIKVALPLDCKLEQEIH